MNTVSSFQENVFGMTIAVPAYDVSKSDVLALQKARDQVPIASLPETVSDDMPLEKYAVIAYGKKFTPVTPAVAKRLEGRTVPAIVGQRWMDYVHSTRALRQKAIVLVTIHGVFNAPKKDKALVISELTLSAKGVKRFTYGAGIWRGSYGTGSGHDPIMVFI